MISKEKMSKDFVFFSNKGKCTDGSPEEPIGFNTSLFKVYTNVTFISSLHFLFNRYDKCDSLPLFP